MPDFTHWSELVVYGNTIKAWLIGVSIAAVVAIALELIKNGASNNLRKLAGKTTNNLDDLIADLLESTQSVVIFGVALFAGSLALALPGNVESVIKAIPVLLLLWQMAFWGDRLIRFGLDTYTARQADENRQRITETVMGPLRFVSRLLLWSILLLLALDNIGIDITALVAGLGVGGIAVALAVQSVLGDLFSSIAIVVDQPFVVGDFIIVDNLMGTVERIGMKTTRVRSLSGEELVFSNSDLLGSRIRNYKGMYERRVVFQFGVLYQTTYEQLKMISGIVREIVESQECIRFDRSHFASYGDSALNFETVYYVLAPEYNTYMDIQQEINLALFKRFEEEGIRFAHPIRMLHIEKPANGDGGQPQEMTGAS